MASNSYYNLNTYPSPQPAAPPGMYSGQGYNDPPSKPALQSKMTSVVTNNEVPPRPLSPPVKPTAQLLSKPGYQAQQDSTLSDPSRQRKSSKWRRVLRVWKVATQCISTLLSAFMFIAMVYTTIKYQTTENTVRGGRTPWPKDSKLWPTFMLLAASGVTLILSTVTILSYCCCYARATASWKLTAVKYVIHLGVWLVVSALYRYEKGTNGKNNDLWGWSCSDVTDALQPQFNGVVGFSGLCTLQGNQSLPILAEYIANRRIDELLGDFSCRIRSQSSIRNRPFYYIPKDQGR